MSGTARTLVRVRRYAIVEIASNAALYLLFLILIGVGLAPLIASVLCYGLGVAASYVLNRRWTFESKSEHQRDLPRFLLAYGAGLIATAPSIQQLVGPLGAALAQLVTIGVAAATIFVSLTVLRFGEEI